MFDKAVFMLHKWYSNIVELEGKKNHSQLESDKTYAKQ